MQEDKKEAELWDLLDVNRIPTGRRHRRGEPLQPDEYHLVVHVCILNSEGEMLVQKRSMRKDSFPGMWDVSAAGSALSGEDSRAAAARELREELGLEVDFSDRRPTFTVNFANGFDDWYIVDMDVDMSKLRIQKSELSEVGWMKKYEALNCIAQKQMVPYFFLDLVFDHKDYVGSFHSFRRLASFADADGSDGGGSGNG